MWFLLVVGVTNVIEKSSGNSSSKNINSSTNCCSIIVCSCYCLVSQKFVVEKVLVEIFSSRQTVIV